MINSEKFQCKTLSEKEKKKATGGSQNPVITGLLLSQMIGMYTYYRWRDGRFIAIAALSSNFGAWVTRQFINQGWAW